MSGIHSSEQDCKYFNNINSSKEVHVQHGQVNFLTP